MVRVTGWLPQEPGTRRASRSRPRPSVGWYLGERLGEPHALVLAVQPDADVVDDADGGRGERLHHGLQAKCAAESGVEGDIDDESPGDRRDRRHDRNDRDRPDPGPGPAG